MQMVDIFDSNLYTFNVHSGLFGLTNCTIVKCYFIALYCDLGKGCFTLNSHVG